jgi:UPF0716 protein FxsA
VPGNELLHGFFILVGSFALITPDILTGIIGFSMLIPQTRETYVEITKEIIKKKLENGRWQTGMYINFR